MAKNDRIRRLVPLFESGRFFTPWHIIFLNAEKECRDFIVDFMKEYEAFPVAIHDDVMDCISRICDPEAGVVFPKEVKQNNGACTPSFTNHKFDLFNR